MEKSSFFNSVSGDRIYKADDWAEYFASFIGNGVFPNPANGLQVAVGEGMKIVVHMGRAWINGYFYYNTADLNVILGTADGVLNRIDRIVLRWDLTDRTIKVLVKPSTASAQPSPPALQRDADAYEICLADVYIRAGETGVVQADITDQRYNTALCGIVVGVVDQIDPTVITAQFDNFFKLYRELITQRYTEYAEEIAGYGIDAQTEYGVFVQQMEDYQAQAQADFAAWFDSIKGILGEDVAGQLALDIAALQNRVAVLEEEMQDIPHSSAAAWLGISYLGCTYLTN